MTNSEEPPYDIEHTVDAMTRTQENAANMNVLYQIGLIMDLDLVADTLALAATVQPEHVHAFRYEHDRGSWYCRIDGCGEEK